MFASNAHCHCPSPTATRGVTLIELLVVLAIISSLMAMLLPALQAAKASSRRVTCANNFRQVGLAMVMYCDDHGGDFPRTTHSAETVDQAWVYTLAKYIENVDTVRLCPDDQAYDLRKENRSTTFVLSAYITVPGLPGARLNRDKLTSVTKTMIAFEQSDKEQVTLFQDHVHNQNWFASSNVRKGTVLDAIRADIAIERHSDGANYLYADGRVEWISSNDVGQWAATAFNFTKPQ